MENYKGSIELIAGLTQKNGNNFPLLNTEQIQATPEGTRLDTVLSNYSKQVIDLSAKVETLEGDILESISQSLDEIMRQLASLQDHINNINTRIPENLSIAVTNDDVKFNITE
jgi:hypothetical protein